MEKEYEIVNNISLAEVKEEEKEEEKEAVADEITPDVKIETAEAKEEPAATVDIPEPSVDVDVPAIENAEIPVIPEAPVVPIPVPQEANSTPSFEMPSFDTPSFSSFPSNDESNAYSSFSSIAPSANIEETSKVFKTEADVDAFGTSLLGDVNNSIKEKAINPMKATVKINEALLNWGRQVVENGLNKALFDRFEEIEAMYINMETATYDDISNAQQGFGSQPMDNLPSFGDDQSDSLGGMGIAV